MPRVTRNSIKIKNKNDLTNEEQPKIKKKNAARRKRKNSSSSSSCSETENASPNKNSKIVIEETSPGITDRLANNLNIETPKANKFSSARRALADNQNFRMPGREKQFEELTKLIDDTISSKSSLSLYINGPPGT